MKYIFAILKLILLLLIICASFLTWSIYTQSGRDFLTHLINIAPLPDGVTLKVKRIYSILPLHLELTHFALQEDKNIWFDVEGIVMSADVLQYLNNKAVTADITAENLLVRKLSTEGDRDPEGISNDMPFTDFLDITADFRLNIHTIILEDFIDDGPVSLQNFDVEAHYAQKLRLSLSGSVINFGEPLHIKGDITGSLDNLQADLNLNSEHLEYQEYYAGSLKLRGNFKNLPSQMRGKIAFSGNPMKLGNIAGTIDVEYADDTIRVGMNGINSDFFNAKGSLQYNIFNGNASAELEGKILSHSIQDIYSLEAGDFNIDVKLLDNILSGSAKINTKAFKLYHSHIDTLLLIANIQGFSLGQDFSLDGVGQTKIEAQGLKAGELRLDTFSFEGKLGEGKVNLNMNALGPELASELSASFLKKGQDQFITLDTSNLEYNKVKMSLVSPTQILWKDEQAKIPMTQFNLGEGNLSLSGTVGANTIDLQTALNLPLEPFGALFLPPEHFVSGNLSSNIHIQGDTESPQIKGELTLENGLYENIEYGAYINDIQTQIDATGKRIDISSFTAKSHNEGNLSLSGYVDLASDKVDFSLEGNSFKLLQSEFIEAFVKDISMKLAGGFDDLECSGNLLFEKGSLDIGVNQAKEIKEIKECEKADTTATQTKTTYPKPLPVTLNIGIGSQPQFKVYGRGLDSIWAGDLQVKGNISEPLISGEIGLERGSFKLLNTVMDFEEGNVIFSGSPENNPYFKVVTTTGNADYKMKVVIHGTPEEIYFDLSSVPSLPRDEIIAQILFGKLSKDLTALEAVQLARSIAALTGGGSSIDIMGELSNTLGVDLISLDFDQQQSAASIHIEKHLNDQVKVITNQSSDIENSSVGVEVKVLENLTVNTERGLVVPDEKISVNYKVDY